MHIVEMADNFISWNGKGTPVTDGHGNVLSPEGMQCANGLFIERDKVKDLGVFMVLKWASSSAGVTMAEGVDHFDLGDFESPLQSICKEKNSPQK